MGSSGPHLHWIVIAAFCGIVYLIFDAARSFAEQLSTVGLRRLSADGGDRSRWQRYDEHLFAVVTGALLQFSLIVAVAATVMVFDDLSIGWAVLVAAAIWAAITLTWKFALAVVPEETSEMLLRALLPFTHLFYYLFWPVLFPLRQLLERVERNVEQQEEEDDRDPTDEEVQAYIDVGEEEGILEASEGKLLQSIVDFSDRMARELMTPRIDVLAFDARRPLEELARIFSESKYSRIPIYDESIDRISGIVHIKEIFDTILRGEQKSVSDLARPPYFVSETKKVSELLREFQVEHLQVAVVVDEFGGTAGLITIEDIIEEIVGDIADEHEDEESTLVDLGGGSYLVSGLCRVDELEELLPDADLEGDDYETVAGLIFTSLGRVPSVGTVVKKNGWQFVVDRADRRRIYRVKVLRDPDWREEDDERDDA